MAVGKQTPQFSATQGELDQQDNESCDSLVLTVSDGSVRVKSEPSSDNENGALTQNEAEAQGSGGDQWPATGDTPPFEDPFDSPCDVLDSLAQGTLKVTQTIPSPCLSSQTRVCRQKG
jgi:hypothetical protein